MWLAVAVQVVVPLFLTALIMIRRQPSRPRWLVTIVAFGMVILYMLISARWDASSLYLRAVIPVVFVIGSVIAYRRIQAPEEPPGKLEVLAAWTISLALIVWMSGFLWFSLRGYAVPPGAVDLASPLSGTHVVLNGGVSPFTNAHFRVRPQHYALDIVGVNGLGARASLFGNKSELTSYVIYGEPVYSPCEGKISAAVDGLPDLVPPARDPGNPAGNHVLIECSNFEVLLAHLRQHSLQVSIGDAVAIGDRLGDVGNSGNTSEPHLHIHAERNGEPGVILDGGSVPVTIDGRFLVRNSIFGRGKE